MTHNVMLNVIRLWRRRQEFSTDQTYTIHDTPAEQIFGDGELEKMPRSLVLTIFHASLLCGNHQSPEAQLWSEKHRLPSHHKQHICVERERGKEKERYIKSLQYF